MIVKKGRNAVNIVTDKWLYVKDDIDIEVGQEITLLNEKNIRL